ncbi:Virulence sensor protein BvgS precursor [compost metagenome]
MGNGLFKPFGREGIRECQGHVPAMVSAGGNADVFDIHALENIAGNNPELVQRLIEKICSSNRDDANQIESLLAQGNRKGLMCLAHRIKGSARLIGALPVQEGCALLEQGCEDGMDANELRRVVQALLQALDTLQIQLKSIMESLASLPAAEGHCGK